ncbi:MAG: hypothetical protein KKA42_04105 [candidate division Zixibacteria bacterium]|nr:hypothetical protein [candidate division Zixibacteria bacterium]
MATNTVKTGSGTKADQLWLVYISAVLAGLLLLAHALGFSPLQKVTARLGIALIYSAFALLVGNGRPSGIIATALIWIAVIVTFLV